MRALAVLRSAVYMSGFVVLWGWVAFSVRRLDPVLGIVLPSWLQPVGFFAIVGGGFVAILCGVTFAVRGRGTPAPFDPPVEFVGMGPYRYVRNPMYVGAVAVLGGYGLAVGSAAVLILAAGVGMLAHAFVVIVEEPGLRRRFGESYGRYTRSVNRWVPRLPEDWPPGLSHDV